MQEHLIFQPEFTYIPVSPESIALCASGVKRGVRNAHTGVPGYQPVSASSSWLCRALACFTRPHR